MNDHSNNPFRFRERLEEILDKYQAGLLDDLTQFALLNDGFKDEIVDELLSFACKATHIGNILLGRNSICELPREWVIKNIERIANETINFSDYWEYRRLLELYDLIDPELVDRLVKIGLKSSDPDVLEAAQDFEV